MAEDTLDEDYARKHVVGYALSGCYSTSDIEEMIKYRWRYRPEQKEAIIAELRGLVAAAIEQRKVEEKSWTEPTVNDRIDAAFTALNARGVIAVQNASDTQSGGWEHIHEKRRQQKGKLLGGAFYHEQDLDGALETNHGLHLSFGAFADGDDASVEVGTIVFDLLASHGVDVAWSKDIGSRIQIKPFEWRKRQFTTAPAIPGAPKPKTPPAKTAATKTTTKRKSTKSTKTRTMKSTKTESTKTKSTKTKATRKKPKPKSKPKKRR